MKQALAALLGAGFTVAGCYAAGALLLRWLRIEQFLRRPERFPLAFVLGAAGLHLFIFGLLAAQMAYWPVIIAAMAGTIGWAVRSGAWGNRAAELAAPPRFLKVLGGLIGAAFFIVYFVYAWAPEHSPDGSTYHLGFVSRYLRTHGFERNTINFYAMLSQGVELIYLPAFAIGRHSAAALTHLSFGVALALGMYGYGCRIGRPAAGVAAALLTFVSPVFGFDASIAYIDVAAAAIVFAAFHVLEIWDRERGVHPQAWRLAAGAGLIAGYAYAAKYPAFTIGIYALGFVLFRAKAVKPIAALVGCALLMAGPWAARNWILYENPTAPLGTAIFRNPYTHVLFEQDYTRNQRDYGVQDWRELPMEVLVRGMKTQGILGPMFFLLPIGILALRRREGRHLFVAGALVFATYFANIGTRFLIPPLPFFSFLIALPLSGAPWLIAGLISVHAILSWPDVIPRYAEKYVWQIDRFPIREALRLIPPDEFLAQMNSGYTAARMIDAHVPEGESVFTQGGVPDAYTRHPMRVTFQSASNEVLFDQFGMGWQIGMQPVRAQSLRFPSVATRRLRVEQIAQGMQGEQWNIHELRFFRDGEELAREPAWRIQAWPNPWDVQMAFDNSPATRWRSWETIAPGMYLEVDFGKEETVDEVRIETSPDSPSVRLQVEQWRDSGWQGLKAEFEVAELDPNPNARRMATYEMHQRGMHYFLLFDGDWGADDVREDPEGWGLKLIAETNGARLYKTTW